MVIIRLAKISMIAAIEHARCGVFAVAIGRDVNDLAVTHTRYSTLAAQGGLRPTVPPRASSPPKTEGFLAMARPSISLPMRHAVRSALASVALRLHVE
jgi:hypothetical protein